MKDTSKQTTFVINTMSEETYKKNSSSGKINENELNIVDDNNTNRMVVASYDMLKNLENATAASNVQLSTAFKQQTDALENIVSSLWQNLSVYAYEVTKDEDGKEMINLKTATQMTSRDLAESILHVATFLSSTWTIMQESHK